MAKKADSVYRPVARQLAQDPRRPHGDFVVVGFTRPRGRAAASGRCSPRVPGRDADVHRPRGSGFTRSQLKGRRRQLEGQAADARLRRPVAEGQGTTWVEPASSWKCGTRNGRRITCAYPVSTIRDDKTARRMRIAGKEWGRGNVEEGPSPHSPVPIPREVVFSNLIRCSGRGGLHKGDLIEYYRAVSPWLLPYLKDRPVVLDALPTHRGEVVLPEDAPVFRAGVAAHRADLERDTQRDIDYFVCNDVESLLYLNHLGTIPLHVWAAGDDAGAPRTGAILDLIQEAPSARGHGGQGGQRLCTRSSSRVHQDQRLHRIQACCRWRGNAPTTNAAAGGLLGAGDRDGAPDIATSRARSASVVGASTSTTCRTATPTARRPVQRATLPARRCPCRWVREVHAEARHPEVHHQSAPAACRSFASDPLLPCSRRSPSCECPAAIGSGWTMKYPSAGRLNGRVGLPVVNSTPANQPSIPMTLHRLVGLLSGFAAAASASLSAAAATPAPQRAAAAADTTRRDTSAAATDPVSNFSRASPTAPRPGRLFGARHGHRRSPPASSRVPRPATWGGGRRLWKTSKRRHHLAIGLDGLGARRSAISPSRPPTSKHRVGRHRREESLRSQYWGDGVYQVHDGAKSWTGWSRRLAGDRPHRDPPDRSDTVYVAARHLGAPTRTGVYKTPTRQDVDSRAVRDDTTGVVDLEMDPSDPSTLYAAAWQPAALGRQPHEGIGAGSGCTKPATAARPGSAHRPGEKNGLHRRHRRIGIAISPQNPKLVFVMIQVDRASRTPPGSLGGVFARATAPPGRR